ncbi:hypothetical protein PCASD_15267 [Puccinia coronata f. sp. avenae]|uniref:CFEM domain-containing protein n=1 Tax=Puccinia coronata f. sp. avenae TaxID=200324 RepID=A0A2N5UGH9_9BASI|nr:hypothetical protein PCASD_22480 [Puccinia coronata f. sp. avenae]PLW36849.1 hypothetical protein PCASD_15267 [Puccinia coronata f. sp. avenae]
MVLIHAQVFVFLALNLVYSYAFPPRARSDVDSLRRRAQASSQRNALPPCGEKCFEKSLSATGSCHPADSWCLCHSTPWKVQVEQCFEATCSPVDMMTALVGNQDFCTRLSQTPSAPAAKPLPVSSITTTNRSNDSISITAVAWEDEPHANSNSTAPTHVVSFRIFLHHPSLYFFLLATSGQIS